MPFGKDLPPALPRTEVPTLVIWGEEDPLLLPILLDGLEQEVDDLTVHRIAGAGHGVVRQQPGRVASLIREFIELPPGE
jgi:pimeloyl-ACP methyl ester carboxylesterase